jgi:hypothetical protein
MSTAFRMEGSPALEVDGDADAVGPLDDMMAPPEVT